MQGATSGVLRFREAEQAGSFVKEMGEKGDEERLLAGLKASFRALEGDEEKQYYVRVRGGLAGALQRHAGEGGQVGRACFEGEAGW